jgi:chromosome segregation ATPase
MASESTLEQDLEMSFTDHQLRQLEIAVKAAVFDANRQLEGRLDGVRQQVVEIHEQLAEGGRRMQSLDKELSENTRTTSEMRDMFDTAKKGLRILGGIGAALKWLSAIAGAVAAVYTLWKGKA